MKSFLFIFLYFINLVFSKDSTINFIKQYAYNEFKPTFFVYINLCWNNNDKLKLFKELSNAGIRSSSIFEEKTYLYDHELLFLVDLDCPDTDVVFKVSKYLRSPFRWLAIHDVNQNKFKSNVQLLWELPLLVDSDFVLAERNGDNFTFSELHKPSPKGPTYSNPRGYYNGSLVDTRSHRELYRRRKDVMGHPLTMANVIQDSNSSMYHMPREDRLELEYDSFAKLSWMNVRIAFEMLNATPRYIFSHRFGYKNNGTWSGMINDLITGKADLGTNCVPDKERLKVAVFTDTIAKFRVKFIFRQPPLAYVTNIFALPFSINVWVALIVSLITSVIAIYFATKWETYKIGSDRSQLDGSVGDAILLTLSAFSQQGCSKEPKHLSGRIMLWVVFTALMAMYAAYSANIVVLLQGSSDSIKTLEQLADSDLTLGALDVDFNHFVLKGQTDPLRQKVYRKVEPERAKGNFYNLKEGVEKIRKGLFAFHAISESVFRKVENTFLEKEKCDLMEVSFLIAAEPYVPVYRHLPYLELLRVTFKQIHEAGIRVALYKRIHIAKPRCSSVAAFSSVAFINIRPLLFFMLYGVATSILILGIEILTHKLSRSQSIRHKNIFSKLKI